MNKCFYLAYQWNSILVAWSPFYSTQFHQFYLTWHKEALRRNVFQCFLLFLYFFFLIKLLNWCTDDHYSAGLVNHKFTVSPHMLRDKQSNCKWNHLTAWRITTSHCRPLTPQANMYRTCIYSVVPFFILFYFFFCTILHKVLLGLQMQSLLSPPPRL